MIQQDLFASVFHAYAEADGGQLDNAALYRAVSNPDAIKTRTPIGKSGQKHSLTARSIRWHQQSLKRAGLLERVERGVWQLSHQVKEDLHKAGESVKVVAFSTDLGVAIWARNHSVFNANWTEPIHLAVSSPPYPLKYARDYGNPNIHQYTDFICHAIEPIAENLVDGGSIVLNLGQDIFLQGVPARSMYIERLLIALSDRLGLELMDRIIWSNPTKPPGPTQWACKVTGGRKQLCSGYEPVYWFTNNSSLVRSDNRRVLEPHTEAHKKFVASGGAKKDVDYGNGAYARKAGAFANPTAGRIPKNVLSRVHRCADTDAYNAYAEVEKLPKHGAMYPTSIPDFFIQFLSEPGDLIVDPFGGTGKTALAAERLGRRWAITDMMYEYLYGGANAFRKFAGFSQNVRIPVNQ